jgi:transposase
MDRFVECEFRTQQTLLPSCLEDYVAENNPVRVIEVFVGELAWGRWGSRAWSRRRRDGQPTIPRLC